MIYLFKPISSRRGLWWTWSRFPESRSSFNPLTGAVSSWSPKLMLAFESLFGFEGLYRTANMSALLTHGLKARTVAFSFIEKTTDSYRSIRKHGLRMGQSYSSKRLRSKASLTSSALLSLRGIALYELKSCRVCNLIPHLVTCPGLLRAFRVILGKSRYSMLF